MKKLDYEFMNLEYSKCSPYLHPFWYLNSCSGWIFH